MPDWLNLDDDQINIDEPDRKPIRKPTRKQRRRQGRADARAAAGRVRDEQLNQARSQTAPLTYLIAAGVLVVVFVTAAYLLPKLFAGRSSSSPAPAGQTVAAPATTPAAAPSDQATPAPPLSTPTGPAPTSPAGTPAAYRSPGAHLAKAFLNGLLTRSSRDDDSWQTAVKPYATPELIAHLKSLGADGIGFTKLSSWRPTKYQKTTIVDQPANTPSRVVSSWIVTVTDGHQAMRKPFGVNEYLSADGTWKVAVLQMPYTSEG